ncbi:Trehalose-6-P synthase/phosphatase complex subunit [Yamadazyma tenuis]|uniref:Uncharacterized protein n=1 Tax=Candida tenuis (strain ATCC 10573 / BCRC 21748 / CBS 615 / JCM 9827 / NBRC 10315 / NRRL Y-1498 / VKM Y-70) TaxID=590646 RepID=G3BCQ7_CANTC|nr:uncharacterized protein CANTEDRAFT_137329 [Yamadazyma tenuis ATCC 10573]EGV60858.1 hypothetical protein CANTEDRAFT_137329 [Yamadazyma tenuis ATCC 10573]WEJ93872.1 Trehalose-6-P synthase/phosphatase complex subunit [Yamadazyma tenuis]
MTIIIGSLFLPYTVQFEVGLQDTYVEKTSPNTSGIASAKTRPKRPSVTGSMPVPIRSSSILPSLSNANSSHISPSTSPTQHKHTAVQEGGPSSVEDFFLQRYTKPERTTSEIFAENLDEKLQPHFIQPRSMFSKRMDSSVVDIKKQSNDFGLPSLKISRSGTNLTSLNSGGSHSTSNASKSSNVGASRANASLNRSALSMSLQNNSSTSVIDRITEEVDDDDDATIAGHHLDIDSDNDWDNDFNEITNPRAKIKLAPFGGFSHPSLEKGVLSKSSIFETSPWKVLFAAKGNGSLIKAVKMAVGENIIHSRKWVGTLAMPSDEVPQHVKDDISSTLKNEYFSEVVYPSDLTFSGHYKSFCKSVLWPTLHYEIPDNPKSKAFEDHSWSHYKALNQMIADKIVDVYKAENGDLDPDDPENMIWIHDYHLLLVPQMVLEKLPRAKIGLFLHVSFPSSEVFRCLAQREALLKGMLGASAISFQTEEYVRHFLQTCSRLLLADTSDYGISYDGRFTMVNTIPVGIDASSLHESLFSDSVKDWRNRIRERWSDQKLIVSRDKLDKLRGIKEKLSAYEKFLQKHPSYIDNTVLIQVCIGTPSDDDYSADVMQIVSRINAMATNISVSQPVVLLQQDIAFDQYLALQVEADMFIVSSMREGLNLTCHEFIIASTERKSPLMLSEFTGSSNLLELDGQGAVLINPWDVNDFSEKYYTSLTMSPEEKLTRWTNCNSVVACHDYRSWIKGCMASIIEAWKINHERNRINLSTFSKNVFQNFYSDSKGGSRLFFINLETASAITSFADSRPDSVPVSMKTRDIKNSDILPPSHLATLLNNVLSDDNNKVFLCSYMKRSTLDTMFRRVPSMGLIAENGAYIKFKGSKKWISIVNESEIGNWMPQVRQLVEAKVERLPGSKAEIEDCTIIFNPGKSIYEDKHRSIDLMGDLIQHVNLLFDESDGIHASLIRNNVVIQQNQLSLRALNFLVHYFNNNSLNDFKPRVVNDSATSTPIKEKTPSLEYPNDGHGVSGLFVSGGTTSVDEPNFQLGNTLGDQNVIPNVLTVAALDSNCKSTSAKYGVAGRNELLSIISTSIANM